jgi:precorrin-2 dehydrogenase
VVDPAKPRADATPDAGRRRAVGWRGFPAILNLTGVPCLVVGAGRVAERKIATLLRAGARVTVLAPEATGRIRFWARHGHLTWRRGRFRRGALRGARIAVAAASDRRANRAVALEAKRRGLFVNVVDDPALCTLMLPAAFCRGSLLVAVSTLGESPAFARQLRDLLAARIGPEYGVYLRLAGRLRRRRGASGGGADTGRAPSSPTPILRLLRAGRKAEARRRLERMAARA